MSGFQPDGPQVNLGAIGATAAMDFWNAWLSAVTAVSQKQLQDSATLFQQVVTGNFELEKWAKSVISISTGWFSLAGFPIEFCSRANAQVPTAFFVVDKDTETASQIVRPSFIPLNATVEVTDLWNINGSGGVSVLKNKKDQTGGLNEQCLTAGFLEDGSQLEVELVSLLHQKLDPGLYLGMVYAHTPPEAQRYPLAMVALLAPLDASRDPLPVDLQPLAGP